MFSNMKFPNKFSPPCDFLSFQNGDLENCFVPKPIIGSDNSRGSSNGSLSSPEMFDKQSFACCLPTGCLKSHNSSFGFQRNQNIYPVVGNEFVKMACDNPSCLDLKLMHVDCFKEWKIRYSSSRNGLRSRHFSDKQIIPGTKSHELLMKLCGCRCRKGLLKFESEFPFLIGASSSSSSEDYPLTPLSPCLFQNQSRRISFSSKDRSPVLNGNVMRSGNLNNCFFGENSFNGCGYGGNSLVNFVSSSCRFSPTSTNNSLFNNFPTPNPSTNNNNTIFFPNSSQFTPNGLNSSISTLGSSSGSSISNGGSSFNSRKHRNSFSTKTFDFFPDADKAAAGNIFNHRKDMKSFNCLPSCARNSYQVRVEDDGPYGNDETRCFILTSLSVLGKTSMECVLCHSSLLIYDKYPLVDGTFFLSSENYEGRGVEVNLSRKLLHQQQHHHNIRFLNVVCLGCLSGKKSSTTCKFCHKPWRGSSLVVGTMYNFDLFSSSICCPSRLNCLFCNSVVKDYSKLQSSFSNSNKMVACESCGREARHVIKPLNKVFNISINH